MNKCQQEAVKRMKRLNMMPKIIKEFEKGVINYSEYLNSVCNAVLYWVSNDEELEGKIEEFEKENDAIVYHVQLSHTEIGDMYSFLYVSRKYEEEWEYDMEDLKQGQCLAYVWNRTCPDCSEFGTIGVCPSMGGVVRTW